MAGASPPGPTGAGPNKPLLDASTTPPPAHLCEPAAVPSEDSEAQTLLRSARNSPLYEQAIAPFGVASCQLRRDGSTMTLSIQSVSGNRLVLQRDPRIEYTSDEARLTSPPTAFPLEALARTERAAFGANGCGIDWNSAEKTSSLDEPLTEETLYRGDLCNCQARVRRDAAGAVIRLILSSTC